MEASALPVPAGLHRIAGSGRLLRLRSDEQLLALFRAGHDEAFRVIHDRYRQRLFVYTRQMLSGSRSDAEDALQDVFLRAYHALRADERPVALRAWLYRVAHNRCIDQLRRPVPAPADVYDLHRAPLHDPLAEAERREDLRRLVADVRRLPDQQRSALLMRELEGLSYQELAVALDVTIPAIKSLLVRARIGLVEATEARNAACVDIRAELALANDDGVRAGGRARRHLRDCEPCHDYHAALRATQRTLAGLNPSGPLTTLAKVIGIGGGSSAAAGGAAVAGGGAAAGGAAVAGGGAAAGGAAVAGGGAAAVTATKVVTVVCCVAVVGGGAAEVAREAAAPGRAPAPAKLSRSASPPAASAAVARHAIDPAALAPHAVAPKPVVRRAAPPATAVEDAGIAPPYVDDAPATEIEVTSGGLIAPDEPADETAATGDEAAPSGTAAPATTNEPSPPAPAGGSTGATPPTAQGAAATPPPAH